MHLKKRHLALPPLIGYSIFGLSISAISAASKLGFITSLASLIILIVIKKEPIPKYISYYISIILYFSFSALWANPINLSGLGNYLTPTLAAISFALALAYKALSPKGIILILLIPCAANFCAYILEINYTAIIYDLDTEAAFKRFGGLVGHPNPLTTRLILPLIALTIFLNELKNDRHFNIILLASVFFALFSTYATGSKKSALFIATITPYLVYNLTLKTKHSSKIKYSLWGATLTTIAYCYFINFTSPQDSIEVVSRIISSIEGGDESTIGRLYMLQIWPDYFAASPVFGNGLDQFAILSKLGYYSHNNYVEIAVNLGLVGLFLYYGMYYFAIIKAFQQKRYFFSATFTLLFLFLDFTGVSYSDRGTQIALLLFYFSIFNQQKKQPPLTHKTHRPLISNENNVQAKIVPLNR